LFKALDTQNNNVEYFFKVSLIFSIIVRQINKIVWLIILPLKIAVIIYLLDYLNYDVIYIYHKLNNLSLGILDWYYRTLVDFVESLTIKNDIYKNTK